MSCGNYYVWTISTALQGLCGGISILWWGARSSISQNGGRATMFAVLFLWCSLVEKMLYCASTGLFSENSFSIDHWGSWFMFFRLLYQANQIQTMTAVQSRISHNWNPIICLFNLYLMFDSGNIDCNIQVVWICWFPMIGISAMWKSFQTSTIYKPWKISNSDT